jgi:hypothetical protein
MTAICIDHDDTFTTDPATWTKIIELLRSAGHDVFCISLRFPNVPIHGFPGKVYYACGQHKWEFAEQNGIHVDIWIDDWPAIIGDRSDRKGQLPPQYAMRQQMLQRMWADVLPQLCPRAA